MLKPWPSYFHLESWCFLGRGEGCFCCVSGPNLSVLWAWQQSSFLLFRGLPIMFLSPSAYCFSIGVCFGLKTLSCTWNFPILYQNLLRFLSFPEAAPFQLWLQALPRFSASCPYSNSSIHSSKSNCRSQLTSLSLPFWSISSFTSCCLSNSLLLWKR